MSDRQGPHKGRDTDGRYRVRQADVEDLLEDPKGVDYLRDDVRLGGAVADTGPHAGESAERVGKRIADNREDVDRVSGRTRPRRGGRGGRSSRGR